MARLENFSLTVFRTVAEKLSFRKAAEALFLTQPAVTLQIKALEKELGVRLFDRSSGRVALTRQGAILLSHAQKIAAIVSEAERELAANAAQLSGTLAVGVSTTIAQYVLPRMLAVFLAEHSQIKLSIHSGNTDSIVRLLLDGRVSIGLIAGPARQRGVRAEAFMEDELVLIAPPDFEFDRVAGDHGSGLHLQPGQKFTESALLLREQGSGSRRVIEAALRKAGLTVKLFKNVIELDSTEAIKSSVEAGLGVSFVSSWAINKERELQTLKAVEVEGIHVSRPYHVVSLIGPEPSGPASAFRAFVLDRARHLSQSDRNSARPVRPRR